jgi:hypothetical protein
MRPTCHDGDQAWAGGARERTVQCRTAKEMGTTALASTGGACGKACHSKADDGGAMRSDDNTHKAQWSRGLIPGAWAGASSGVLSSATCRAPSVVQTSTQTAGMPWLQARARETVGAKAPSSITHSTSRLSLRS